MRRPRTTQHRRAVLAERATGMRGAPTTTEVLLWQRLRGARLGVSFRRQVVIGDFIADLAAPSARLVVEVDGAYHAWPGFVARDARRDRALARLGWRVVRVPAQLVQRDLEQALALIRAALDG
jgi:very-short-patch-repair endonuclease